MVIHYHHAIVPNSGYLKRMKNIDRDLVGLLGEKSVEVEFYPRSKRKYVKTEGLFKLSQNVIKKYYIEVPDSGRFIAVKKALAFILLSLRYKPSFVIGEAQMLPKLLCVFRMFAPKAKLIFDCHGAVAAEAEYQGRSKDNIKAVKTMEGNSVQLVDYVVCQSSTMKKYIVDEYGVSPDKICVYRCGVDSSLFKINNRREEIRRKLGVEQNDMVFVYSGGLDLWQRVGDSLDIFLNFHRVMPSSKFLILTMEEERLNQMLKERDFDNDGSVIIRCLPFTEVPDYLNACDVAFLLRDNHVMNAVASPTKLAEYMACGLPVITSKVAESWVDERGRRFCIFEEELSGTNLEERIRVINRNDVSEYASSNLSLDVDKIEMTSFVERIKE